MDLFSSVDLTLAFQTRLGPVSAIMQIISLLGLAEVYLVLIPAVYWLYDPRLGIRVALIVACTGWSNDILKQFFHLPRPYWISPYVQMLDLNESISFGFPSGHSQIPVTFLGMVGYWLRSTYFWIFTVILLLAIGLSRIYLGVHFSLDILGGWSIGIAILIMFILLDKPVCSIIKRLSRFQIILMAFVSSLIMTGLSSLVLITCSNFSIPPTWAAFDHNTTVLSTLFSPANTLITTGLFFGISAGWTYARDETWLCVDGSLSSLIERYLLGIAGLAFIFGLLGLMIHSQSGDLSNLLSWLRGAFLGLWISYGAPLLFHKMGFSSGQIKN